MGIFSREKWLKFAIKSRYKKLLDQGRVVLKKWTESQQDVRDGEWIDEWHLLKTWLGYESIDCPHNLNASWLSDQVSKWGMLSGYEVSSHSPILLFGDRSTPTWPLGGWNIFLDNFRSTHNVGSVIRSIEAFRLCDKVYVPHDWTTNMSKIKKVAMGADKYVDIVPVSIHHFINICKKPLVVLETMDTAISLYDWILPEFACSIVFGNEERGCSDELLESADICLSIPTGGYKRSLNVANVFAIVASYISAYCRKNTL